MIKRPQHRGLFIVYDITLVLWRDREARARAWLTIAGCGTARSKIVPLFKLHTTS